MPRQAKMVRFLRLQKWMIDTGTRRDDLVSQLHVARSTFDKYMSGLHDMPLTIAIHLSQITGLTLDELFGQK